MEGRNPLLLILERRSRRHHGVKDAPRFKLTEVARNISGAFTEHSQLPSLDSSSHTLHWLQTPFPSQHHHKGISLIKIEVATGLSQKLRRWDESFQPQPLRQSDTHLRSTSHRTLCTYMHMHVLLLSSMVQGWFITNLRRVGCPCLLRVSLVLCYIHHPVFPDFPSIIVR
jgi:hypothetical protein